VASGCRIRAEEGGRDILARQLEEGILVSSMPKSPVRLVFPTHLQVTFPRPVSPGNLH
jgi:hypothetical protein